MIINEGKNSKDKINNIKKKNKKVFLGIAYTNKFYLSLFPLAF
jgi:hypothetical protein